MITRDSLLLDGSNSSVVVIAARYEILGLLGTGGMGSVYRVRDRELDEIVALKFLRREMLADARALQRFREEAKLARRVSHRNVARTFDIGAHWSGEVFLTMEYIDGEPLSRLLEREGRLSPQRTAELARQLCAGLEAAHAAGVVHRDLKPDNVLVEQNGRAVITDFGVAFTQGASTGITGGLVGTPAYMSPEQVEGRVCDLRVDIYALGAVMFELLTGKRAWEGDEPLGVAARRLHEPPPDPRSVRADVPASMAAVVVRCMARNEDERFVHASDVMAALDVAIEESADTLVESHALVRDMPVASRMHRVAPAPQVRDTRVAVLPFENRGLREDDFLAEELTDELTDTLSMSGGCRVRPRRLVERHDASDLRALGRALDVHLIVEGAIRRTADRVRISARVIAVVEGLQIWGRTFEAPSGDVLAVHAEVARAILDTLARHARPPQGPRVVTDPIGVELYIRARQELRRAWGGMGDIDLAVELFRQGLARAPDDAGLLSGYAMSRARRYNYRGGDDDEIAAIRALAERAIVEAPHLGEPWMTLATPAYVSGQWPDAVRALRKALHLAPGLLKAHEMLAHIEVEVGRIDEGLFRLETLMSLDPTPSPARWEAARVHALRGQWDRAAALLALPVHDDEDRWLRKACAARFDLWRGEPREPLLSEKDAERDPRQHLTLALGYVVRERRFPLEMRDELHALIEPLAPRSRLRPLLFQFCAELCAFVGDGETALAELARSVDADLYDRAWLEGCPVLARLRSHPSWARLAARVEERGRAIVAALDQPLE